MSDNKLSIGLAGLLVTPMKCEFDEACEILEPHGLSINYECTIIYQTKSSVELYEAFGLHYPDPLVEERTAFIELCQSVGHPVQAARTFVDLWYDGTDSNISDCKAEDFPS